MIFNFNIVNKYTYEQYKENKYIVYKHVNKINGKVYIGCTCNLKERWKSKGCHYHTCTKFKEAIDKYGWDSFEHIIIKDNLTKKEGLLLEEKLIKEYDSVENGYNNMTSGLSPKHSKESLNKLSNSLKEGYIIHPERKEKIRNKALNRKVKENTKLKISLNNNKNSKIEINGEIGSIRYWAKRIGVTHPPLIRRKNIYGTDNLIKHIKNKLSATSN